MTPVATALAMSLILIAKSGMAAEDCRLSGLYKANGELTLSSYEKTHLLERDEERQDWKSMFSALSIEWQCDRFRAWSECGDQAPCPITDGWQAAEVTASPAGSLNVHFPSGLDDDWRVLMEGECYRIERLSRGPYWEYFCRVTSE